MRNGFIGSLAALAACTGNDDGLSGVPLLGNGEHSADALDMRVVALDEISEPADLAFHPDTPDQAWIVSIESTGLVIADGLDGEPEFTLCDGPESGHFATAPSSIAFGKPGFMATTSATDELTQGHATPPDFMGPTLWTSDAEGFDAGVRSHYDMLHNSPLGMGTAWERDNVYWIFDGYHRSLTRYDFHDDHGPAGVDHSDGEIARYVEGEVGYDEGIPSHLAFDDSSGLLYVADTDNSRIAVLDTQTGERGRQVVPDYDGGDQYEVTGTTFTTLIESTTITLVAPSGVELHDGVIYVSDNSTGLVSAYSMDGELLDFVDLGLTDARLTGMAFDASGNLWVADAESDSIVRLAPVE